MRSDRLWEQNKDLATACLEHPFLQGLASGALPREKFAWYLAQDASYLQGYARAYALALGKAPDAEGMLTFKEMLDGAFEEMRLHHDYAKSWGVSLDRDPAPATRAYVDFLLRVAALEPVGHIASAMAPCMRLYAWLGRSLQPLAPVDSPYRSWIDTYASDAFEGLAVALEEAVDRYGGEAATLAAHYRRAMELEQAFFEAAWQSTTA